MKYRIVEHSDLNNEVYYTIEEWTRFWFFEKYKWQPITKRVAPKGPNPPVIFNTAGEALRWINGQTETRKVVKEIEV